MASDAQADQVSIPAPDLLRRFDAALEVIDRLASYLVIAAMATLTTVICVQVFYRYVLNDAIDWGWDVPRLCFIWVALLAIPLALKLGAHTGIETVVERLKPKQKQRLHRINAVLMIWLMVTVAYYATFLARRTWDQMLPGLELSVGWFYVAAFISAVHSVLHLIRLAWTGVPPTTGLADL